MTFIAAHRFAGGRTRRALLRIAWEGEHFGAGLFGGLVERFPERAEVLTACEAMERLNIGLCEDVGPGTGVRIAASTAGRLVREGGAIGRHTRSFERLARIMVVETAAADPVYERLARDADTPELARLGEDLLAHENALRTWMQSELDGASDGGAAVFAYLDSHGIASHGS